MHSRVCLPSLALLVVVACGPKSADTTEGSEGATGGPSTSTASTSTGTTAPTSSTGHPEDDGFGFACIELLRAESEESDPFVGTARIKATLRYEACLIDYYTKKHPEQAYTGTEGPQTFDAWAGRLCSEPVSDPLVACTVDSFEQILLENPPNSVFKMTVTYEVSDPARIDGRTLLWGPGPLETTAECEQEFLPHVRMTLQSDVVGLDQNDAVIWIASSFSNPQGLMQQDTAGCIQADISRVPPGP